MTACLLLSLFSLSCQDELPDSGTPRVEEGLPATVRLTIKPNEMEVRTRSIVDEDAANYCDNIWIGFYSKATGERLDYCYNDDIAATAEKVGTKNAIELELSTKSANDVYVVAVANVDVNDGITNIDNYSSEKSSVLRDILDKADTFAKFKSICLLRPDPNDVNVYANTLTMSGYYSETDPWQDESGFQTGDNIPTINIANGENNLSGAIYLRRVISYNKFVIVPGDYVTLKLNTWSVHNIPAGCYIFEQDGNVADNYSGDKAFYNASNASHSFTATEVDGKSGHFFEFYQLENKHEAVDIDESLGKDKWYNEREREYKTTGDDGKDVNSGIYKSLVKSDKSNMWNNNASYVVVNATIDYYVEAPDDYDNFDPTTAVPVAPNSTVKKIHRTANVDYTIHLGYCEDKDKDDNPTAATASDFNCRRNTKYLYNVTINGVKNVVVEAKSDDGTENQPGAEGWVSDEIGEFETLDSHYCEFNICLSDAERSKMSYRISAPYDGKYYYYSRDKGGHVEKTKGMNEQLYQWIKFFPTSGKDVLAEYNGGKGKNSKGEGSGLWTFDDMCEPTWKKNDYYEADADGNKWYTVFVDEYVYTFDDSGPVEESWPKYVNQNDRLAEFIMNIDESKDSESTYSYCKYAFGQKSIQTYYKGVADANGKRTAIGIEHEDETYCLNMNWRKITSDFKTEHGWQVGNDIESIYDLTNGRFNQILYLDTFQITKWDKVIQEKLPAHVNADANNTYGCSHPAADYPVYMPYPEGGVNGHAASPNDGNAYRANSICMNRNRDLNGNGVIDVDEVRWFSPTGSQYIQMALGQAELPDPLLRFTDYSRDYFVPGWSGSNSWPEDRYGTYNFHYIASDFQYYWAEQAVTTGDFPLESYNGGKETMTYTVRCVRNLGTNPGVKPVKDSPEVGNAFTYDSNTRIFTQNNFTDNTLRGYNRGAIAPHDTSDPSSRPYKYFQVASDVVRNVSDGYVSVGDGTFSMTNKVYEGTKAWTNSIRINGLCGKYTEDKDESDLGEWRVPTAYEFGLMWIENILRADNSYAFCGTQNYFVDYYLKDYSDNNQKYIGYNPEWNRKLLALDCYNRSSYKLRCVRDVKQ
jgi:hypothetical protein